MGRVWLLIGLSACAERALYLPEIERADLASPDLASPDLASADLASADLASADLASPDLASRPCTPDWCGLIPAGGFTRLGEPASTVSADFNHDGAPDIASSDAQHVAVLVNDGNGGFPPEVLYDSTARLLAVADVNHDGNPDLVSGESGGVRALLGQGDGTFTLASPAPLGDWPRGLAVGDFNADGNPDVIAGIAHSAVVLLGAGDGTFTQAASITVADYPLSFAVGEVTGDAHLDVVVGASASGVGGRILLFAGAGDGSFQVTTLDGDTASDSVELRDLDGDGVLDLATSGGLAAPAPFATRRGHGDGSFDAPVSIAASNAERMVFGDFDGDGALDLILGESSLTFRAGPPASWVTASPKTAWVNQVELPLAVADFDGDGHLDLAGPFAALTVLRGNGDGTFAVGQSWGANLVKPLVADFDGDGRADLVGCGGPESLSLGSGDFHFHSLVDGPTLPCGPMLSGLFDSQAPLDLVTTGSGLTLLTGAGGGRFNPGIVLPASNVRSLAGPIDFDEDGRADLALGTYTAVQVRLSGAGSLSGNTVELMSFNTAFDPLMLTGRFNRDAHIDLAVLDLGLRPATLYAWLGNGDGSFAAPVSTITSPYPASGSRPWGAWNWGGVVADIDHDGLDDVLVSFMNNPPAIFRSNGDGSFTMVSTNLTDNEPLLSIADFNRDGYLDLIALAFGKFRLYLGQSDGSYLKWNEYDLGYAQPPQAADLDGDGRLDAVVGTLSGARLYRNTFP